MAPSIDSTIVNRAPSVPPIKLTENNYHQWKDAILIALAGINARRIVTQEEPAPRADATQQYREYTTRCEQAASLLHRSCGYTPASLIAGNFNPVRIWQILDEHYGTGRPYRSRLQLLTKFQRLKMTGDIRTAGAFIAKMREYQAELAHSEDALTDRRLLSHLLTELPERYATTVTVITHLPLAEQTLDRAALELQAFEDQTSMREDAIGGASTAGTRRHATALTATSRPRGGGGRGGRGGYRGRNSTRRNGSVNYGRRTVGRAGPEDECRYCHHKGHWARECRKRQADRNNGNHSGSGGAGISGNTATAVVSTSHVEEVDEYFAGVMPTPAEASNL
ncbi:hypothetical protein BJ508DRAFT_327213 [Ascobolus immersus RN42]|uniref:CCHC-type domain-containing protein n=1 Tax=Ascobolus immersus RN42 TaxID=1160509 RepID=A0A3N4IFN6_ASCIM|nr:hypothetical protein BJ508DRAFT_327213 [Ascobolus immersus RN42]